MNKESDLQAKSLSDLLSDSRPIVMLMTMVNETHTARPITCLNVDRGRLSFLVNAATPWVRSIRDGRAISFATVSNEKENVYLSLSGSATISQLEADIDALWNPVAGVFFEGRQDPDLAALHFDVAEGQYWTGPSSKLGQVLMVLKAAVSANSDDTGDEGTVLPDA